MTRRLTGVFPRGPHLPRPIANSFQSNFAMTRASPTGAWGGLRKLSVPTSRRAFSFGIGGEMRNLESLGNPFRLHPFRSPLSFQEAEGSQSDGNKQALHFHLGKWGMRRIDGGSAPSNHLNLIHPIAGLFLCAEWPVFSP